MNQGKRCFVIMPFGKYYTPEYDRNLKIYQLMIKPVVEQLGYQAIRADELEHMGNITRDIIELLHESDLVVADLSGKNANVFYELGVRHALFRCGTIPIIREGETLPFDIANYRAIFYSSELDGPDNFKKELERRIRAFERIFARKSDNPVHDILGNKLLPVDLDEYVLRKEYEEKIQQIKSLQQKADELQQQAKNDRQRHLDDQQQIEILNSEKATIQQKVMELTKYAEQLASNEKQLQEKFDTNVKQLKILQKENDELKQLQQELQRRIKELEKQQPEASKKSAKLEETSVVGKASVTFRSKQTELSEDDVKKMLKKHEFFDSSWNEKGTGFSHQYDSQKLAGDAVVVDHASGLMWQQGGSSKDMIFDEAEKWVKELNRNGYAGFNDWRLPTLEEAMSLMEPKKKGDLYIDPIFDTKQRWIWTCDKYQGAAARWYVDFYDGNCTNADIYDKHYVRAVRSGQLSSR